MQASARIVDDMPIELYHADHAVSKSGLKLLLDKTPSHYFHEYRTPGVKRPAPGKEKVFGAALHDYMLSPLVFAARYVEAIPGNKNRSAYRQFKADAEKASKLILDAEDMERLEEMKDALYANDDAMQYFGNDIDVERSFFWTDEETGVRCKCRPDILVRDTLVAADLKTCRSAKEETLRKDIYNYGYHIQDASYTAGVNVFSEALLADFAFIFIENTAPYGIAVYRLSPAFRRRGYADWRRGLEKVAACEKAGIWPSYAKGIREIDPPTWVMREDNDNMQEGEHEREEDFIIA